MTTLPTPKEKKTGTDLFNAVCEFVREFENKYDKDEKAAIKVDSYSQFPGKHELSLRLAADELENTLRLLAYHGKLEKETEEEVIKELERYEKLKVERN